MAEQTWVDKLAAYGRDNPLTDAGQYWANDNAEFDATKPGVAARVLRGVNPMTGFGSAMGAMHTAASNGDALMMALSAFGAIPVFGATKAVTAAKALIPQVVPSIRRTLQREVGNEASQLVTDRLTENRRLNP